LEENMPEALIGMGNIYIQQANYPAAIETLTQALQQVPTSPEAHYALANAYAQNGDVAQACETFQRFIDLNPPAAWQTEAQNAMSALGCE